MASELYVETLKGLTSGANANKVIIPSGQELIAPGHVIGFYDHSWNTGQILTSTSYADITGSEFTYTPKSDNSTLFLMYNLHTYMEATTGANNGFSLKLLVDSSEVNPPSQSYEHYNNFTGINWEWYTRAARLGSFTNTSTATKTIKLQGRVYYSGGGDRLITNNGSGNSFYSSIIVQEIAG